MTRIERYDRRYGMNGAAVRKSIAKVAAAGRHGDQAKIGQERCRHRNFMACLP
jgi:hypothetical protein